MNVFTGCCLLISWYKWRRSLVRSDKVKCHLITSDILQVCRSAGIFGHKSSSLCSKQIRDPYSNPHESQAVGFLHPQIQKQRLIIGAVFVFVGVQGFEPWVAGTQNQNVSRYTTLRIFNFTNLSLKQTIHIGALANVSRAIYYAHSDVCYRSVVLGSRLSSSLTGNTCKTSLC